MGFYTADTRVNIKTQTKLLFPTFLLKHALKSTIFILFFPLKEPNHFKFTPFLSKQLQKGFLGGQESLFLKISNDSYGQGHRWSPLSLQIKKKTSL